MLKFIYSEKATKFCEISTNYLSYVSTASQIIGGDFEDLLIIYELYQKVINNMLGKNDIYPIQKGIPHHAHALRNEGFHDKYEWWQCSP